ncbi:putative bifunctional diguanylate cyclase/phosphodiesterase [Kitasatospora sp. NPDC050543]|uniref:putative bifunctional diguanylate cyclase/phosphodiesterase n=1 Tax=Kitasatospora sp. NPDC050543 TaxID=3364054 RepID=UPI0037B4296C
MGWLRGRWSRHDDAWWAFLMACTAVIVAFVLMPSSVRYVLPVVLSAATSPAIVAGVRMHGPPSAGAWYVLAAGTVPYAAADAVWGAYQVRGEEVPFPGPVDGLYLVAYLLFATGLLMLTRWPAGRAHWAGLLDAGIVTLGFATLSWVFILGPYTRSRLPPASLAVTVAYPVTDLVLLCLAARLVLTAGSRGPSFLLLVGWLVTTLGADALYYGTVATTGSAIAEGVSEVGWMVSYACLGAAALHPSVARMAHAQESGGLALSHPRLAVMLALSLLGPAIVVCNVRGIRGDPSHIAVLVGMMAALAVLLVLRVSLLARYAQARAAEARGRARALEESLREQSVLQQRLSHQAFHDPLTGLANRLLLGEGLEHVVRRHPAPPSAGLLLLLDLDGFKYVHDTLGHPTGDELLVAAAHRLLGGVRGGDLVARLGGDEFAVLVEELNEDNVSEYVERILGQFRDPFVIGDHRSINVTASVGARLIREPTGATDTLRDADVALYVAKAEGKNRMVLFEPHMRDNSQDHAGMAEALRNALSRDELLVYYQPVVDLATGEIAAVEALLRWARPHGGLVPPDEFIPVAEETGVIVPIGAWVMRQACLQARRWREALPSHREIAVLVNISGRQLRDPGFADTVAGVLRESGLDAGSLVLEISEGTLGGGGEAAAAQLATVRGRGVRISLGGFGSGAALTCLRDVPIDIFKIDPGVVLSTDTARDDLLVRAIVDVGRGLGLDIVAEGVDTLEQADRLRALGCPQAQGFRFGRPMPGRVMEWHLLTRANGLPRPNA